MARAATLRVFLADPRRVSESKPGLKARAYSVRHLLSQRTRVLTSANTFAPVDIFGSGEPSQTVAHQWLEKYKADNAAALSDLVNCILQCAGCDLEVTPDDIRDPENIPNRLIDLQGVYQEVRATQKSFVCTSKADTL